MKSNTVHNVDTSDAIEGAKLKSRTFSSVRRLNVFLRPVLTFVASPQLLGSRSIKFVRESDDLDTYKIARYEVAGVLVHIQVYIHSEKNHVSVYVDFLGAERDKVKTGKVAVTLICLLGLETVPVFWVNDDFDVSLKSVTAGDSKLTGRSLSKRPAAARVKSIYKEAVAVVDIKIGRTTKEHSF